MDRAVVALGGGTIRYEWNRDVMRGTGVNVLLTADLNVIADHVRVTDRPRVNAGTSLEEDPAQIWGNHKELYLGWADLLYKTDQEKSVAEEVDELLGIIAPRYL